MYLKRKIDNFLMKWRENPDRLPLIVKGSRQIGKTESIRHFAIAAGYESFIEINFVSEAKYKRIIDDGYSASSIVKNISFLDPSKKFIDGKTLIFFDEITEFPEIATSLKFFKEDGRFDVICSGSLLGVSYKRIESNSVGYKYDYEMLSMDFEEFLWANGFTTPMIDEVRVCFESRRAVPEVVHQTLLRKFKEYLVCGGLPRAVEEFLSNNVGQMRILQSSIYGYYRDDASKYDEEHKLKIRTIYDFLPSYMENKVKRIQYAKLENKKNANLERYQDEFDYLVSSGISLGVKAIANPVFPLVESASKNLIKLYYNDVGLLSNILYKNNINAILNEDRAANLGSVYETACAMELAAHGHELYYFDSKKVGEVDFLINDYENQTVLPIEIKSGNDQNNFRAIPKLVKEPYSLKRGFVFGNENTVSTKANLTTFPIYMIMFI